MDGYTYLILQTLPIISAVALLFCLMGLYFGSSKYRQQLAEAEEAKNSLTGELSTLRKGKAKLDKELKDARNELRQARSGKAKSQPRSAGKRKAPPLQPAKSKSDLVEKEAATSQGGTADLGTLYSERPETVDDLKRVRGIGKVMEVKLNESGIYTFAQVARWTDGAAVEFGSKLAIAGNVERYNWREQCAKLHKEKYHEDV